jgi:hypothetical protein
MLSMTIENETATVKAPKVAMGLAATKPTLLVARANKPIPINKKTEGRTANAITSFRRFLIAFAFAIGHH